MKHNLTIDRLRGFSVLAVVCMHALFFLPSLQALIGGPFRNGYYGVTVFFCISGFLITTNLLKRYGNVAAVDLRAFYVMRFGRIAPPLGLLLLTLSLLSLTSLRLFRCHDGMTLGGALFSALTFTFNVYVNQHGLHATLWAVLWSLSIEEMFSLGYPVLSKLTPRPGWLVAALVGLVLVAPVYRHKGLTTLYDYLGCFDGIALGALTALVVHRGAAGTRPFTAWMLMAGGMTVLTVAYLLLPVRQCYQFGPTIVAGGAALILFASQCELFRSGRPWRYDPLAYLGRLSYEMYLFHMTIFALLKSFVAVQSDSHLPAAYLGSLLCVVAASDVIHRFYAEPLNRWLRQTLLAPRPPRALHSDLILSHAAD